MATRMQQRRGTAAQWISTNNGNGPILAPGEIGFESDTNKFKIGDGVNHWVDLTYFTDANSVLTAINNIVDGAPALLDTLNEIAAALNDDPNFFTTVATNLSNHESDTTNVHGIEDTSLLATKSYVDTAIQNSTVDLSLAAGTNVDWNALTQQFDVDLTAYATSANPTISGTLNLDGTGDFTISSDSNIILNPTTKVYLDSASANNEVVKKSYIDAADNLKAPIDSPTFTGTVSGITKSMIGLSNVDNTSDTNKPISIATQAALDLKAPLASPIFTGIVTVDNIEVGGSLTFSGTATEITSTNLNIADPLIYLADGNPANINDLGFVANYNDGTYAHTGLVRDASDNKWKLFKGVTDEPTNTVNFTQGSLDTLAVGALETSSLTVGSVSNTEIGYLDGVTSSIQTQLNEKAVYPTQTGNSGKYLTTDGTNVSWGTVSSSSYPDLPTTSGDIDWSTSIGNNYVTLLEYGNNTGKFTAFGLRSSDISQQTLDLFNEIPNYSNIIITINDGVSDYTYEYLKLDSGYIDSLSGNTPIIFIPAKKINPPLTNPEQWNFDLITLSTGLGQEGGPVTISWTFNNNNLILKNNLGIISWSNQELAKATVPGAVFATQDWLTKNYFFNGTTIKQSSANNSAFGHLALSNAYSENNSAFGFKSNPSSTYGGDNSSFGARSLYSNTTGGNNSAFGTFSLGYNSTGNDNSAFGAWSLANNSTGSSNSAFGYNALNYNQYGSNNSAFGKQSLYHNTYGGINTAIGVRAQYYNTTGVGNTSVGAYSGFYNTTGNSNTFIGKDSGYFNTTGYNNTFIGFNAGAFVESGYNNIVIGSNAQASSSSAYNEITLGNSYNDLIRAAVTSISSLSDMRDKTNIRDINVGLDFIKEIRPVIFEWQMRDSNAKRGQLDAGFIAQELLSVEQKYNTSNWSKIVNDKNLDKLEAAPFRVFPILIKAIQEIALKVEELEKRYDII